MSLHQAIAIAKKFLLGIGAGIGVIIIIALFFQLGVIAKNILFPPPVQPPNHLYDKLPAIPFPQNVTSDNLTYSLNTITGTLPELPDRINVFPIKQAQPNFLNLDKAKGRAKTLRFVTENGILLPEINLGNNIYQWTQTNGLQKRFTINIITFDFALVSNYLNSPTIFATGKLRGGEEAVTRIKSFLEVIDQATTDIDFDKTLNPPTTSTYVTKPQLFAIENNVLVPMTSLAKTQVIRVDLYQKNMIYELNTGIPETTGGYKMLQMDIPILYPRPPYSTMNFWITADDFGTDVVAANFTRQTIEVDENNEAIYPIKTSKEAFEELTNGKAYIASYHGAEKEIHITNVFLAYYIGEDPQKYLMPIVVFEGDNGFFAYISAVRNEWTTKEDL